MALLLVPRTLKGLSLRPGERALCVVFLDKILHSHSVFLYQGISMGTCKPSGKPDEILESVGLPCNGFASRGE